MSGSKIRQIMVKAHTRPLTMVKYNREGDLLFTTGKDHTPSIYYADNGERIGTYDGHCGTVWCIDVNCAPPSWGSPGVGTSIHELRAHSDCPLRS